MIEIREELDFYDLKDRVWGQACQILEKIEEEGKERELMNLILECFSDVPSMVEVNDFIAYEWEFIYEQLDIDEDDEDEEEE